MFSPENLEPSERRTQEHVIAVAVLIIGLFTVVGTVAVFCICLKMRPRRSIYPLNAADPENRETNEYVNNFTSYHLHVNIGQTDQLESETTADEVYNAYETISLHSVPQIYLTPNRVA